MTEQLHHSTAELSSCVLCLRPDLTFRVQEYQGAPCYVIEDELNSRFYRVGVAEYNLISLLDGTLTVGQAIAQTSSTLGEQAINEHEAIAICNWLIQSELASTQQSRTVGRIQESQRESQKRKSLSLLNPISTKIPFGNPDRVLAVFSSMFGWLFSFPAAFVWMIVVGIGGYQVWSHWDQATKATSQIFDSNNWIYLGVVWIALKLLHEFAHGIACKRFGGTVRQAGIVFILLLPLPFVDVTSIWKLDSKWKRIFVAAAGMYVEIFVAALAAIIWAGLEPGISKQILFNLMLAGSVTTLLFNANPLMKFDGYYMLSDWLELPNLATHGQQWLQWLGKRYYLGLEVQSPSWPEGRLATIAVYAVLAFLWRILICITLILAAEAMLFGLGLVLAIAAFWLWVVWPMFKLLKFVFWGEKTQEKPSAIRFVALTGCFVAAVWSCLNYVPWHSRLEAPAIVDFDSVAEIRTPVSGFVREILVASGELVEKGQLLIRLENKELNHEINDLQLEIEVAKVRASKYQQEQQFASFQIELNNQRSLERRLDERLQQQSQLELRAIQSGRILGDRLAVLQDTYVSAGHPLFSIGTGRGTEVQALISQNNYDAFQIRQNEPVDVHVWGNGHGTVKAKLKRVVPQARLELPHPAFASTSGGPLPVRFASTNSEPKNQNSKLQLLEPHFLGFIEMPEDECSSLCSGQRCTISFRTSSGTVGSVLYDALYKWFSRQRAMTTMTN